jgi:cleavage and polyadenylation specificity factor subunit 3
VILPITTITNKKGIVHDIVRRGGRCLIPVFALGRAQELLLILDEYWEAHQELWNIPIYYASTLAKKCMSVYQTYINMMNERIRAQFSISNPFIFKHISNLKSMEHFDDSGPCVVMASPGMLQVLFFLFFSNFGDKKHTDPTLNRAAYHENCLSCGARTNETE